MALFVAVPVAAVAGMLVLGVLAVIAALLVAAVLYGNFDLDLVPDFGGDRRRTFPCDPAMSEDDAKCGWLLAAPARVVVAAADDLVLGTANMYVNRPGPGSHVASGSLMAARQARGKGVGRALTADMISWARGSGFAAIQSNAVVDTSTAAVLLDAPRAVCGQKRPGGTFASTWGGGGRI